MRLSLLAENANTTAGWAGALLVALHSAERSLGGKIQQGAIVLQGLLIGVVALTNSRAAIVALSAVFLGQFLLGFKHDRAATLDSARTSALKLTALIVIVVLAGGAARWSPAALSQSGSVENRRIVWLGICELVSLNPEGLGAGNSGYAYMQWIEPTTMTAIYGGTISSFLSVACEYGLPIFGLILFLLLSIGICGWHASAIASGKPALLTRCASAVLTFLTICGLFSTIHFNLPVALLGVIAFASCCYGIVQVAPTFKAVPGPLILGSLGLTVLGCIFLVCVGRQYADRSPCTWKLVQASATAAKFVRTNKTSNRKATLQIIADKTVLGSYYGKTIRASLPDSLEAFDEIHISEKAEPTLTADVAVLCGSTANQLESCRAHRVVLVNPAAPVPPTPSKRLAAICISTVDNLDGYRSWVSYGGKATIPVHEFEGHATFVGDQCVKIFAVCQAVALSH